MLSIELPKEIDARLERLARKTGRTKADYVREALLECLDGWEEELLTDEAIQAISEAEEDIRNGRTQSLDDFRREIGL